MVFSNVTLGVITTRDGPIVGRVGSGRSRERELEVFTCGVSGSR